MFKLSAQSLRRTASCFALAAAIAAAAQPAAAQPADPLAGVNLGNPVNLEEVILYPEPAVFCHWLEKSNAHVKFSKERADAAWNGQMIQQQITALQQLEGQVRTRIGQTQRMLAEATQRGDGAAISTLTAQLQLEAAALPRIRETITRYTGYLKNADEIYEAADAVYQKVLAKQVESCGAPEGGEFIQVGDGTTPGGFPPPDIRPVDIPLVPRVVCDPREKDRILVEAARALENAFHNRTQWEMRAAQIEQEMREPGADTAALGAARVHARGQAAYAELDVEKARQAFQNAEAIRIAECAPAAPAGGGGGMIGSLQHAIGVNPSGRNAEPDGWGAPGESGNRDGVGILTRPEDRPFDGSEARYAVGAAIEAAEKTVHHGGGQGPVHPPKPVMAPYAGPATPPAEVEPLEGPAEVIETAGTTTQAEPVEIAEPAEVPVETMPSGTLLVTGPAATPPVETDPAPPVEVEPTGTTLIAGGPDTIAPPVETMPSGATLIAGGPETIPTPQPPAKTGSTLVINTGGSAPTTPATGGFVQLPPPPLVVGGTQTGAGGLTVIPPPPLVVGGTQAGAPSTQGNMSAAIEAALGGRR